MSISAGTIRATPRLPEGPVWAFVACGLTVVAAGAVIFLGMWSIPLIAYSTLGIYGIVQPARAAMITMVIAGAFEAGAIDYTRPIGESFIAVPAPLIQALPITISPFEIVLLMLAIGVTAQRRPRARVVRLPLAVWVFPVFLLSGAVYGLSRGAEYSLVYHEGRGLIFATVAFYITLGLRDHISAATLKRVVLGTAILLAVIVLYRYFVHVRPGDAPLGADLAFAHEDAILLGLGFVVATVLLVGERRGYAFLGLLLADFVIVAAMIATTRRSATLMLLVAMIVLALMLFRSRPMLIFALAIPTVVAGAAYLAVYWNQDYGALAQPARAIRSQFDPSPRDDSSDQYRDRERYNVTETIRYNQDFGVGFGRPFAAFRPQPDLTDRWPLQWFSPHNNIIWLWLKMGILGATVALSVWVLALQRALGEAWRGKSAIGPYWPLALVVTCGLLMYFTFARVDLALLGSRSAVPLGCLIALAFVIPRDAPRTEAPT